MRLRDCCSGLFGRALAGDFALADTTLNIPHPYNDGIAEKWISNHRDWFEQRQQAVFAVVLRASQTLIGSVGLQIHREDEWAELGYWIGIPYWNQGYATEAARALLAFGFEQLNLNRNPASGRVMQKLGMTHEGCQRQHVKKWDGFEDLELYGILKPLAA